MSTPDGPRAHPASPPSAVGDGPGGGAPAEVRPRLVRDRTTVGLYTPYVAWGWVLYSFNPSVPLLADELGISGAQAGLHGTAMATGTLLASVTVPRAVRVLGRRGAVVLLVLVVAVGVTGLVLASSLPWTLGSILVAALGGSGAIAAVQVGLADHTGPAASAAITEGNGVGSSVGLVGPLAVGACVAAGWGWRPGVAVAAVLAVVAAVVVARLPPTAAVPALRRRSRPSVPDAAAPEEQAAAQAHDAAATGPAGRLRASTLFLGALVAAVALENATTYWAADLVLTRTDAGPGIATATTAGLVAGMSAVRFVTGPLSLRVAPVHVLAASFVVAIGGWAVLWTATDARVALAGLVLAGVGYGAQYPLSIALLLAVTPGHRDRAQAHATLAGALALAVAPFLLGALGDTVGPHLAFLVVPALAVAGALTAVTGGRLARREAPGSVVARG
ncbi:MFS transporter [Cellulomonas dongxiuzhuiae]|uniref:MFS transporter n=1 Tax=Cellulomonas dongxiuzhuiae TaxID=2819979 RepID=A0ABX8GGM0_9CELL|nr:MFS transporter [Cellulomonas dongxiuzhuiae]MBO3093657.1 MFS transporter [Cellulomonas dongxiuzhuiae]QWC14771.1 MFS transporter [Cellulomonas dongxiuzhuiae]